MITFGICLIYYGIALFLYQTNTWMVEGVWRPFPVSRAWEAFFGSANPDTPVVAWFVNWFLSWPLSLTLILSGLSILGLVWLVRWAVRRRRAHLRRKWLLEQCRVTGYMPWNIPHVLESLDAQIVAEQLARQHKTSQPASPRH